MFVRGLRMAEKTEKFYIYSRYCPRRLLVASKNYKYFVDNGLREVYRPEDADLIIIHSCGGFNSTEENSLSTLEKALKVKSNSAKIIFTGCLPKINKSALTPYKGVLTIPTEELSQLDSLINSKVPYDSIPDTPIIHGINKLYRGSLWERIKKIGFNRKLFTIPRDYLTQKLTNKTDDPFLDQRTCKIEISRGCVGNCTYCAIKLAQTGFHSLQEEQIIENFRFGLKQQFKKFIITGCDIGAYGIDNGTNFPNLLNNIFAIEGDYSVILNDMNPRWLVKYHEKLFSILQKNTEKVSKIILPIQSASNRILALMNRQYDIDEVQKCITELHEKIPTINLETHLIVGFPGETEQDFCESLDLLKYSIFSKVWVYKYEDRPGTVASKLKPKVTDKIIKKRVKKLRKVVNIKVD